MTIESSVPAKQSDRSDIPRVALRLNNISELRLLFAASVVLSHAIVLLGDDRYRLIRIVLNSEAAVQGFFILSGYLVFGSFDRIRDARTFYVRRLLRIYPAYFVAVCLFLILGLTQALLLDHPVRWPDVPAYLAANLVTLNFLKPTIDGVFAGNASNIINGALWSIKVEMMFYATVPLLYIVLRKTSPFLLCAIVVLIGTVWWPVLNQLALHWGASPPLSFKFQLPGQIHYFGLGIALFARSKGNLSTAGFAVILVEALLLMALLDERTEAVQALVLVAIIGSVSSLPQIRDIFGKQDVSYGIYLCHFPLIQLLLGFGPGTMPIPLYLGAAIVLVVGYGFLSWNYIERPALRLKLGQTK